MKRISATATAARLGLAMTLLAGLALAGCETTGGLSVTSPYFHTADGYLYKYGNFCGPGWPNYPEGNTPAQNIALIDKIEPVDDIDRVCRAHDRCYWEYGQNNAQCDRMLAELLRDHTQGQVLVATGSAFLDNEFNGKCANLAGEILSAVGQFKQGSYLSSLASDEDARNQLLGLMSLNAIRNMTGGFPEVPGLCFFKPNQLQTSEPPANTALAQAIRLAGGQSVSLTSFEPFLPADDDNLAAGRAALAAFEAAQRAAQEADAAGGGGGEEPAQASP